MLTISQLANKTGVSTSALRVWEKRYGWPKGARDVFNGYRLYPDWMAADVKRVAQLVKSGAISLRELIVDGAPKFPNPLAAPPPKSLCLRDVPEPSGAEAARFRLRLVEAINARSRVGIRALEAESVLLHPQQRPLAFHAVMRAASEQGLL